MKSGADSFEIIQAAARKHKQTSNAYLGHRPVNSATALVQAKETIGMFSCTPIMKWSLICLAKLSYCMHLSRLLGSDWEDSEK